MPTTTFTATDAVTSGPDVGEYPWSDPLNWSNGVPVNGDNVVIASGQGIDDITTLSYLDSLTYGPRAEGSFSFRGVSVIGSLTIANAAGGIEDYIYAGTERSQAGSVTIDNIGGTGLLGLDAITNGDTLTVVASSDPNVEYSSAGLLITNATPGAGGYLDYPGFSGILALTNPGSVVQAAFLGVNVGVSVELPGSTVTNVAYTGNVASGGRQPRHHHRSRNHHVQRRALWPAGSTRTICSWPKGWLWNHISIPAIAACSKMRRCR